MNLKSYGLSILIFVIFIIASGGVWAASKNFAPVPVWAVLGNTVPYQSVFPDKLWPDEIDAPAHQVQPITYSEMIKQNLPFDVSIANRRFERYQTAKATHFITPICIVGHDPLSLDWLRENASALAKHGAVCLIARARSLDEINQLKQAAPGVSIQPASAQQVINQLDLRAYPALIFNGWVVQ